MKFANQIVWLKLQLSLGQNEVGQLHNSCRRGNHKLLPTHSQGKIALGKIALGKIALGEMFANWLGIVTITKTHKQDKDLKKKSFIAQHFQVQNQEKLQPVLIKNIFWESICSQHLLKEVNTLFLISI